MKEPTRRSNDTWLLCGLAALGALAMYRPVWSMDFGMHLASGRWILEHGRIPITDPWSFTAAGEPWIVHEWLAQVGFALIDRVAGIEGLKLAAAACCGLACAVFGLGFRRRGLGRAATLSACLLLLYLFESRFRLRPHLITMLGTALLFAAPRLPWSRRRNIASVTVFVVWLNCHGGWILVPVHLAMLTAFALITRRSARAPAVAFAACLALSLLNPRGWLLLGSVVHISDVAGLIPEWASAFELGPEFALKAAIVSVIAGTSVFALVRQLASRKAAPYDAAVLLWPPILALTSQRFLFLAPLALATIGRSLPFRRWPARRSLIALVPLFLITQGTRWAELATQPGGPGRPWATERFPKAAVDWLASAAIGGRVLCPPPWSGYLMARLGARIRVAIDGRVELYGRRRAIELSTLFLLDPKGRLGAWPPGLDPDIIVAPRGWQHREARSRFRVAFAGPRSAVWIRR